MHSGIGCACQRAVVERSIPPTGAVVGGGGYPSGAWGAVMDCLSLYTQLKHVYTFLGDLAR
jgi:hypothetical protein